MTDRPTGNTQWVSSYGIEFFKHECVCGSPPHTWKMYLLTDWRIDRLLPFTTVDVYYGDHVVKRFWRRSSAKAYVEVCYKLGVHG